jgi:pre-mRNA-splicing factor ATP-dependent RNA helicase DHX15/PRP43
VGRLLEYAANYFDLNTFPNGESKDALKRIANKRAGKVGRHDGANGEESAKKKRKKA